MRLPPDVAAIWKRWEAEEINLVELVRQLQACGFSRRDVYADLERRAGGHAEQAPRGRFRNGPSWKGRFYIA